MADTDTLVLGSGLSGLSVAALLAAKGEKVRVLEAHEHPGGYAHTFPMGKWSFCAQVHYIFSCGEGETIARFLESLGLSREVEFNRLDPEGFDHVVVAGERYRIPNGLDKYRERLIRKFPDEAPGLREFFRLMAATRDELELFPAEPGWRDWVSVPFQFSHLMRERNHTLQDVYDRLQLSARLQTILAGQAGDYLLPPNGISFLLHTALVTAYDRGAYYPKKHFKHLVDSIVKSITSKPGCEVLFEKRVEKIEVNGGQITGVKTNDGVVHTAKRYISNIDPKQTVALTGAEHFPSEYLKKMNYEYSMSAITMYLATKDIDLRDFGFGSFNTWYYPHDDINAIYARQNDKTDFSNPWIFISTPSLHSSEPGLAPPDSQTMILATNCASEPFCNLRKNDFQQYRKLKKEIHEHMLDAMEKNFIPNFRKHLAFDISGTPPTNERYCLAPNGNAYGSALTPQNVKQRVPMETPISNLWLCNASTGWPSVAGTIGTGMKLHEKLTGSRI